MRTLLIVILLSLALASVGCSKPTADPVAEAAAKAEQVNARIGELHQRWGAGNASSQEIKELQEYLDHIFNNGLPVSSGGLFSPIKSAPEKTLLLVAPLYQYQGSSRVNLVEIMKQISAQLPENGLDNETLARYELRAHQRCVDDWRQARQKVSEGESQRNEASEQTRRLQYFLRDRPDLVEDLDLTAEEKNMLKLTPKR